MTTEEHLMKILGGKDIQIASLMAQLDTLRDQIMKVPTRENVSPVQDKSKSNGEQPNSSVE